MRIAIVGMGVSGINVLYHLKKEEQFTGEIVCYDKTLQFGCGLPYQEDYPVLLVNSRTDEISLFHDDPKHFRNWLVAQKIPIKEFMPRSIFGEYLSAFTSELIQLPDVSYRSEYVRKLEINADDTVSVISESNEMMCFDAVFLCLGHAPAEDIYGLSGHERFVEQPYPLRQTTESMNSSNDIAIIGMGLTAIDEARVSLLEHNAKTVTMFSRSGLLPTIRGITTDIPPVEFTEKAVADYLEHHTNLPLEQAVEWFVKDCNHYGFDYVGLSQRFEGHSLKTLEDGLENLELLGRFQSYCSAIRESLQSAWIAFTREDQMTFSETYEKHYILWSNPMATVVVKDMIEWIKADRLELRDDIAKIDMAKDGRFELINHEGHPLKSVDWVLNGTGSQKNFETFKTRQKLVKDLLNQRLIEPFSTRGLLIDPATDAIAGSRFGQLPQVIFFGQMVSGIDFQNNSTFTLNRRTKKTVKRLVDYLRHWEKIEKR